MKLPPKFWIVIGAFDQLGTGFIGDPIEDEQDAWGNFSEHTKHGKEARVFVFEMDVETNALETTTEITADFYARQEQEAEDFEESLAETRDYNRLSRQRPYR